MGLVALASFTGLRSGTIQKIEFENRNRALMPVHFLAYLSGSTSIGPCSLEGSGREPRPLPGLRRSALPSPTATRALSTNSLHSVQLDTLTQHVSERGFSICRDEFVSVRGGLRGESLNRDGARGSVLQSCVARPSPLLRHAASSILKQRWWLKCALARTGNSFTPSN